MLLAGSFVLLVGAVLVGHLGAASWSLYEESLFENAEKPRYLVIGSAFIVTAVAFAFIAGRAI